MNIGISFRAVFSAAARGPGWLVLWLGHSSIASISSPALRRRLHVRLDRLVERPRVAAGVVAGVRDDRRLPRHEVAVDPAELHALLLVPAPVRFLRARETPGASSR